MSSAHLDHAYATTIHKAQGMTLPLVDVSMRGIFEPGQNECVHR